jgi:hypothetical protein
VAILNSATVPLREQRAALISFCHDQMQQAHAAYNLD